MSAGTPSDMRHAKDAARVLARERVRGFDAGARRAADYAINTLLIDALGDLSGPADPEGAPPITLMGYAPIGGEVDLGATLIAAIDRGWRVALPRVETSAGTMEAVAIDRWPLDPSRTETAFGSLRQPDGSHTAVDPSSIGVALVPGVAFDAFGGRVGRGAGYYDRFLAGVAPRCRCWGIAWSVRVLDARVPAEAHDRPMDALVTESGILRTRPGRLTDDRRGGRSDDP